MVNLDNKDINESKLIGYLVGCAIRGETFDISRMGETDPDELIRLADRHMMSAAVAGALEFAGINTEYAAKRFARGMWRTAQLETDWFMVRDALEEAGVWYCPLKGMYIKDLYPAIIPRQMADFDILFDSSMSEQVCEIMKSCGFSVEKFSKGSHDVYHKKPVSNFEMHRMLFWDRTMPRPSKFYQNIKERLIKDDCNSYGYHMSLEDCYLYVVAHAHKHFAAGGTGLRSLLDVYVYLRSYGDVLDWQWIYSNAQKIGIAEYEKSNRLLAQHLFDGEPLSHDEEETLLFMSSGTYGSAICAIRRDVNVRGGGLVGKFRYVWDRVFPPADSLSGHYYRFFYRHKYLMPFLFFLRVGKAATVNRKKLIREATLLLQVEKDEEPAEPR